MRKVLTVVGTFCYTELNREDETKTTKKNRHTSLDHSEGSFEAGKKNANT